MKNMRVISSTGKAKKSYVTPSIEETMMESCYEIMKTSIEPGSGPGSGAPRPRGGKLW